MSDGIRDAEGKRPSWMELEAQVARGCAELTAAYESTEGSNGK